MDKNISLEQILSKIENNLGKRYDVSVSFQPANVKSVLSEKDIEAINLNAEKSGKVMLPLNRNGSLEGYVVVDGHIKENREQIIETIQMIMEGGREMQTSLELRDLTIRQMERLNERQTSFGTLLTRNKIMTRTLQIAQDYAKTETPIYMSGETGSSQEELALSIHAESGKRRFISSDEVGFGKDLVTASDILGLGNCTLYIANIIEIPQENQEALAEFLNSPAMEKSNTPRVIVSGNRVLNHLIEKEKVIQNLRYKLGHVQLKLVPLRERREDLIPLIDTYVNRLSNNTRNISVFTPDALSKMLEYDWPGNTEELYLEIERLIVAGNHQLVNTSQLATRVIGSSVKHLYRIMRNRTDLNVAIEDLERRMITDSLKKNNWNKSKASKALGISRSGLIQKVDKYRIAKNSSDKNPLLSQ